MTDLIERLKQHARAGSSPINDDCAKAIDEIERLQAAKRAALAIADERSKEACAMRAPGNGAVEADAKMIAAEKLAKRVLAYVEQPNGLPPSSNMEADCELYFLATDFLDAAGPLPATQGDGK